MPGVLFITFLIALLVPTSWFSSTLFWICKFIFFWGGGIFHDLSRLGVPIELLLNIISWGWSFPFGLKFFNGDASVGAKAKTPPFARRLSLQSLV
jgi:hypothetical protein